MAGFEGLVSRAMLDRVLDLPVAAQVVLPAAGLVVAFLVLRTLGRGASPSTSDEYIAGFHDRERRQTPRIAAARVGAAVATLGTGGALGFEGPSIYMGSVVGSTLQHRFSRYFSREDARLLMVAGAAAGVSAIFRAPATGAVFALEVPYQEDVAPRSLLPALVASAASYLVYVAVWGTAPLIVGRGSPSFDARDLLGALAVGLLAGFGARLFASLLVTAKHAQNRLAPWARLTLGGVGLAGLVLLGSILFSDTLLIGPGYRAIAWAADTRHALVLVAALFVLRALATSVTIAGGGAGGLFIPLVVQGAVLGRLLGEIAGVHNGSLFALVGAAAFLGAGYRTPIAAVIFVTESTSSPGFVVPALIATVLAQLVMGRRSVSEYQQVTRAGHLERRLDLHVRSALTPDAHTCGPTTPSAELLATHFPMARARAIPVVEDGRVLGMVRLEDVLEIPEAERAARTAADIMREVPVAGLDWTVRAALSAMQSSDVDRLAVADDGRYVGVITTAEIVRLDEILDETEEEPPSA